MSIEDRADDEANGARHPLVAKLENGLTLVYEAMPWLPSISATLVMPYGSATDPEGLAGTTNVMQEWMQRGAGDLDSRELTGALEDLGVRWSNSVGRENSGMSASFLASELENALPLLASVVIDPRFDDAEFEASREVALQELHSLEDAPATKMFDLLVRTFVTSPQGRSPFGTAEGIAALTPGSVREEARRNLAPSGAVLALAGGADWERVQDVVLDAFGRWTGEGRETPKVQTARPGRSHVDAETSQVQIGLAYPGPAQGTWEAYVYAVALNVLSGSMGSRLFTEVREKRGLVYSVSAFARYLRGFGYTIGYAGTTPERADETLEVFLAELKRLERGVTADELERAKTGILSSLVMQGESSGATAGRLASDTFNLGAPRTLAEVTAQVESVSLSDVNEYVASHPVPDPTVVTLGPAAVPVGAGS